MTEEDKASEKPKEIKLDLKSFKTPKWKSNKLAAIFGGIITGIIVIAVIITFFNLSIKVSGSAAETSAEDYITGNFLAVNGMTAEATGVIDEGNYYSVDVDVMQGEEKVDSATVYVSKDGKYLIVGQAYSLSGEESPITSAATAVPEVPKSDKPTTELFIMSYCPHGLQMQKGFLPVMKLFGDKIDASVKWVHYIMHGEEEATENTRQYCIQEEQGEKYWDYANCFVVAGDVDKCLTSANTNINQLQVCMDRTTEDFGVQEDLDSGEQFPRYKVTAEESEDYGVRGSPAMIINGQQVSIGRSPEEIKQAICAAFNEAPEECEEILSTETPSPGLGGGTGSSDSGYCG